MYVTLIYDYTWICYFFIDNFFRRQQYFRVIYVFCFQRIISLWPKPKNALREVPIIIIMAAVHMQLFLALSSIMVFFFTHISDAKEKLWAQSCMTRMRVVGEYTLRVYSSYFYFFFSKTVFNGIVFFSILIRRMHCKLSEVRQPKNDVGLLFIYRFSRKS